MAQAQITDNGTLSLRHNSSGTGDIISLYGNRFNQPTMYGFGAQNGALYSKAYQKHYWYIGTNQDDGASAVMELTGSTLIVDGKIRSEEVKVEIINGPDYVFEQDYELRTLKETKKYISENKHLPEIPSAHEMEENGLDLGDMNMRLLKKIEELTLYQIQLLEKLEQQNKQLLENRNRIEKLEKEQ